MGFKNIVQFIVLGAVIFFGGILSVRLHLVTLQQLAFVTTFFAAVILLGGTFIGFRFHNTRVVFTIFALTIAERSIFYLDTHQTITGSLVFNAISVLLPINIAVFAIMEERGIVTPKGIARIAFILVQPLIIYLAVFKRLFDMRPLFAFQFFSSSFLNSLPFPQVATFSILISAIALSIAVAMKKNLIETGMFWCFITTVYALSVHADQSPTAFYFTLAGLILFIALIESGYAIAFHDELTELPARRAMRETFMKISNTYSVAMVDIDHFKSFNDRYGHDIGDEVLRLVASRIMKISGGGKAYRYGGEEFLIVFPGKNKDDAAPYCEQLRQAVETAEFVIRKPNRNRNQRITFRLTEVEEREKVKITISIGLADKTKDHDSYQDVIKAADKALYYAKEHGRNKVCV